jgi:hypothetical protein
MKHFCDDWIQEWCDHNGWSDWFLECRDYWAYPPHAVMPLPIPKEILMEIKASKGLSFQEKLWFSVMLSIAILGLLSSYFTHSPMPLVFAFAFTAIIVANLELEY